MTILDLLWNINVSDNTKYLFIIGLIICLLIYCVMKGKKKNKKIKKNNKKKPHYFNKFNPIF